MRWGAACFALGAVVAVAACEGCGAAVVAGRGAVVGLGRPAVVCGDRNETGGTVTGGTVTFGTETWGTVTRGTETLGSETLGVGTDTVGTDTRTLGVPNLMPVLPQLPFAHAPVSKAMPTRSSGDRRQDRPTAASAPRELTDPMVARSSTR